MPQVDRATSEAEISRLLLEGWDPLGVRSQPGAEGQYLEYAHQLFGMLARGASDVQIARHLHHAESEELHHPELRERDLTPLVRALRSLAAGL